MPKLATATALVFFHRFFALQSFRRHGRFEVACTCLFLATKVEESPKKLQDVIATSHNLFFLQREEVPSLQPETPAFERLRSRVLTCERALLQDELRMAHWCR